MKSLHRHSLALALLCLLALFGCGAAPDQTSTDTESETETVAATSQPIIGCTGLPSYANGWHVFLGPLNIVSPVGCSNTYDFAHEPFQWDLLPQAVFVFPNIITIPPPKRPDNQCWCTWTKSLVQSPYPSDCIAKQAFRCGYGPGCAFTRDYVVTAEALTFDWALTKITVGINGVGEGVNPNTGNQCWRQFVTNFYKIPRP